MPFCSLADAVVRLVFVCTFAGLSLFAAHAFTGYARLKPTQRRPLEAAQLVFLLLTGTGYVAEAAQHLRAGGSQSWALLPVYLAPAAVVPWGAAAALLAGAAAYFALVPAAALCRLRHDVRNLTAEKVSSDTDILELHERLRRLTWQYPPLRLLGAARLHAEIDGVLPAEIPGPVLVRWALGRLRKGHPVEALRLLIRADPYSCETLALSMECSEWSQILAVLESPATTRIPKPMLIEATQLMGCAATPGLTGKALPLLRQMEGNERRAAGLLFRQGRKEDAAKLLSRDMEARHWVQTARGD